MRLSRFALGVVVGLSFSSHATAQEPVYRIGRWAADSFGNHRAVVSVEAAAPAVWAHLPWRRPDLHPESKAVWVVDAKTGQRVMNVARGSINRESGDIAFEPTSGPGEYFVYYLRYAGSVTSNYPKLTYPGPDSTAAAAWLALFDPRQLDRLPPARLVAFEAADTLDSFYPMQVIATKAETDRVLARSPSSPFLIFPEDRTHPIVMPADLPARWVGRTGPPTFSGTAFRGEFYAFQLGVWAARVPLADVRVEFAPLMGPADLHSCLRHPVLQPGRCGLAGQGLYGHDRRTPRPDPADLVRHPGAAGCAAGCLRRASRRHREGIAVRACGGHADRGTQHHPQRRRG